MEKAVRLAIGRYNLLRAGDCVLVAVSGGRDSMALAHALAGLSRDLGIRVVAGHVEHGIRAQQSLEDARFVQRMMRQWGIPLKIVHVDVKFIAEQEGDNLEQAARRQRYAALAGIAKALGATRIATAHHMQDQAETLLLRMMRGCGLDGLCGILPNREDGVIRPLLLCRREQIDAYCLEKGIPFREDGTNADTTLSRNYVRHRILPSMQRRFPAAVQSIARTADALRADAQLLHELEEQAMRACVRGERLHAQPFARLHPALRKRVMRRYLLALGATNLNFEQVERLERFALCARQNAVAEVENLRLRRMYDELLPEKTEIFEENCGEEQTLHIPGDWVGEELTIEARAVAQAPMRLGKDPFVQYFDGEALGNALTVRHRRAGDYIYPLGAGGKHSLKKHLIARKIPANKRDRLWLLTRDSEVLWIIGYDISQRIALQANTRRVIRVQAQERKD